MSYKKNITKLLKEIELPEKFNLSSPSKVGGEKKIAFSLPASNEFSCRGETKACGKCHCYAMKGRHRFPNVQLSFARNWKLWKHYKKSNAKILCAEKLLDVISHNRKFFRVYESGDFDSQFAVNVWEKVIKARPTTSFWAYTRSFDLNFERLQGLPNFNLLASTDTYNVEKARKFVKMYGIRHAYGPLEEGAKIPKNTTLCPAVTHKIPMDGACIKCKLCIKKGIKINIGFPLH